MNTTLLAGATGLVGRAFVAQWPGPGQLHLLVRRAMPTSGTEPLNVTFTDASTGTITNRLWRFGDVGVIDGFFVNGTARVVGWFSGVIRRFQSGMIYHYAFTMIIGLFVLLTLWFVRT